MSVSKATGSWVGTLKEGEGSMKPAHAIEAEFGANTRFEGEVGTNPEEFIGAALSGCFSMALSVGLEKAGITPKEIRTEAQVHLEKGEGGFSITRIELSTKARIEGGDEASFRRVAEETKKGCPVAKLCKGAEITLQSSLFDT